MSVNAITSVNSETQYLYANQSESDSAKIDTDSSSTVSSDEIVSTESEISSVSISDSIQSSDTSSSSSNQSLAQIKIAVSQSTSSMSAQDIADKYGITVSQAQQILDELEQSSQEGNSTFELNV